MGARFYAPVHPGPGAYPAPCTMGTGSFPGVKWPGRGVDHSLPSSAEVKERVELYLYSPSGPSWPVIGRTLCLVGIVVDLYSGSTRFDSEVDTGCAVFVVFLNPSRQMLGQYLHQFTTASF